MKRVRFETIELLGDRVEFMYYWENDTKEEVSIYGRMSKDYAWEYCFGLPCIQDFIGNPVVNAIDFLKEVQFDYEL